MNKFEQFEAFFERYQGAVQSFFRRRGLSKEDALDLTQETFLEIHKSLSNFDEAYPRAWVLGVARNRWLKYLRSSNAKKRSADLVPIDDVEVGKIRIEPDAEDQPSALKRMLDTEKKLLFRRELEALPPQMKQCLRLRMNQGMKYREIASVMQINVQTVKSHLGQAKARLQRALGRVPGIDEGGQHG